MNELSGWWTGQRSDWQSFVPAMASVLEMKELS